MRADTEAFISRKEGSGRLQSAGQAEKMGSCCCELSVRFTGGENLPHVSGSEALGQTNCAEKIT